MGVEIRTETKVRWVIYGPRGMIPIYLSEEFARQSVDDLNNEHEARYSTRPYWYQAEREPGI